MQLIGRTGVLQVFKSVQAKVVMLRSLAVHSPKTAGLDAATKNVPVNEVCTLESVNVDVQQDASDANVQMW